MGIFEKNICMSKNTSVLLGNHFEKFISEEVASGRFGSVSEVIRSALRLLEIEEQKVKHLRYELELGEKSGMISNIDTETHLSSLHKKYLTK